jgi:hypothetical protein
MMRSVRRNGVASTPLQNIRAVIRKHLEFTADDMAVVDALITTVTAIRMPQIVDVLWIQHIASPGSGKTEIVRPFELFTDEVVCLSTATPNSLVSGTLDSKGEDPSLLLSLDGKVLIIKDMTTLMSMPQTSITQFYGSLRDAYDGNASKASGTEGFRKYKARFGMYICATGQIDEFGLRNQQLGERFLTIRTQRLKMPPDDRVLYIEHAEDKVIGKATWRAEIERVYRVEIDRIYAYMSSPKFVMPAVSSAQRHAIALMADCLGLFRTVPINGTPTTPEMPTRLASQLSIAARTRAACDFRTHVDDSDLAFLRRLVMDTFHPAHLRIIQSMYTNYRNSGGKADSTLDQIVSSDNRVSRDTAKQFLAQYTFTGLATSTNQVHGKGESKYYGLSNIGYRHLRTSGLFEPGPHNPHPAKDIIATPTFQTVRPGTVE